MLAAHINQYNVPSIRSGRPEQHLFLARHHSTSFIRFILGKMLFGDRLIAPLPNFARRFSSRLCSFPFPTHRFRSQHFCIGAVKAFLLVMFGGMLSKGVDETFPCCQQDKS